MGEMPAAVKHTLSVLRVGAGVALILLGIVGLFLPFLQGILFIVLGLMLLGYKIERKLLESKIRKLFKRKATRKRP